MKLYIYGWWLTYEYPSEKYEFVNGKDSPILNKENKTCLKPPTRKPYFYVSEIGDTTNAEMRMPYLLKIMIEIP